MYKQLPRPKGFTLVELLVVIAIIAVIIGILMPSLASARAQSKFVACGVNLRTIGQMIHTYALENKDRIPRGPSFRPIGYEMLLKDVEIATSQLWTTEYKAMDCGANPPEPHCCPDDICPDDFYPAEYMGLGLLTKKPGKIGNEFLYCPDDASLNPSSEGPKISWWMPPP